ncbi:MAG: ATP synthase F1 subunit epsilon [Candidatus Levybacteria bacterium]|nr:ATP synthase F1 subunit epsilon [Candidatus Levybacteria bacterium]
MTLHLEIISPEKVVFSENVDEVIVPTTTGQITVLPQHVALFTQITPGELIIKRAGKEDYFAVTGGFLEVAKNKTTILADFAVHSHEIDAVKAEEAKKRAEKLLAEKISQEDVAVARSELVKSLLELKVAKRRKHHLTTP